MGKQIFFDQPSNPARAQALQQLILKRIDEQLKNLPNLLRTQQAKAHELFGSTKVTAKELERFLKKNDYDMYRVLKDLKGAKKTLQRAFGEYLTTDADFFQRKGAFEVLLARDEIELTSTLKSFDNLISGTKSDNLARHHGHLSSLRNLLKNVSRDWRDKFTKIAGEHGYKFGDEGIELFDVIAHKPFSTFDKGPNKGLLNPKGILKDMGLQPLSRQGNTVYHRVLNKLEELAAHGNYASGTLGLSLAEDLGHLEPEEAFKIARNLLDVEKVQSAQGHKIHSLLKNWQKNKAKYGGNVEAAFKDLESILNSTNKEGKLRYPAPDVTGLIDEYKSTLAASRKVGQRLGGIGSKIRTSNLVKPVGTLLKSKPVRVGLGFLPVAGALTEGAIAGTHIKQAIDDPTKKNIGAAVGSSMVAADQITPGGFVGEIANQVVRQYTDPERGPAQINTIGKTRYSSGVNKHKWNKKDANEYWKSQDK